jgi:cytoskeleton protein RodZ
MSDMAMSASDTGEATDPPQQDAGQGALAPGAQLCARRQELNWSIEQVANQLNLAPRQILALESDNYAALPGMASVRGFIRSYAKLLKLDATPLLAIIAEETGASSHMMPLRRALPATPFAEHRLSSARLRRLPSWSTAAVVLVVLLAAGVFVAQKMRWISIFPASLAAKVEQGYALLSATAPEVSSAIEADSRPNTSIAVLVPNAEVMAGMATGAVDANSGNAAAGAEMNSGGTASSMAIVTVAAPSIGASGAQSSDKLVLKLREESWIDIRRPDNSVLISGLFKAGSTETFNVTGPISLTVGNAAGVDATLRGTPLALQSGSKNNVARLNLK